MRPTADVRSFPAGPPCPLLERCLNRFVGKVLQRTDVGDHVAFVLEPVAAEKGHPGEQFPFHRAKRIEAGHEA